MALKVGELYASFGIDSSGIDSAISGIEKKCSGIASSLTKGGAVLSAGITAPIIAFAKETYNIGTEFQAQMSRVQGISGATATELAQLTQTAKDLGASSTFSASQAAEGMEYLASAGFNVTEIIAAMPGMLDLAASSGEDLGTSADIAASILRGFGMEASEAARVADVLAKNSAATNAAVYDTGEAMKFVAPLANTMGLSFEEVTAAIGLMANAGIKGSQAGTTLRGALSRLAKPTDVMQAKMEELGISFYNSDGKMKSLTEMVSMLKTSMAGLTEQEQQNALVTLFGQEALSGMMVLLEAGPEELAKLTKSYEECGGAASKMAEIMLDNLKGAVEGFSGAIETAQINLYDRFAPAIKDAVQKATDLVNSFNLLDDSTKDVVYKVIGLAAAAGPAMIGLGGIVGAVGKLIPLMTALVSPLGIVTAGVALFGIAAVDAGNDIGKGFVKLSKSMKKSLSDINKNLSNQIKTVSKRIPALAASLSSGLGEILPETMKTATLVITGFAETIASNASSLAGVGLTIVTSIVDGLSRGLPRMIPAAAQMVASIVSALIGNAPRLLESAAALAGAVWDGICNTDWLALGQQIISAIGAALSGIVSLASGWFEDAKSAIQNLTWSDIATSIKSGITIASDWLKNLIAGDAGTDTVTWKGIGTSIWSAIKSGISATGDWVKQLVLGEAYTADAGWDIVGKAIWSKIKSGISATGDWLAGLILPAGTTFTAGTGWSAIGEAVWGAIKGGISATGDWLASLIMPANTTFSAGTGWKTIGSSVWTAIQGGISTTGDWLASLIMPANTTFEAGSGWETIGETVWSKIQSGIKTVGDWLASLIMPANTTFVAGEGWTTIGKTIWEKIQTGITATGDWIKGLILGNAFTADSDWTDVGEKIVSMISSGLSKLDFAAETMAANLTSLGTFVQTFVKNMLESKVDFGTSITTFVTNLVSEISSFNGWTTLSTTFGTIATSIIDGIVSAIPNVVTGASKILHALASMISGANPISLITGTASLAAQLVKGIAAGIPRVTTLATDIVTAIGSLLSSIKWESAADAAMSLGTEIINAIKVGISGATTVAKGIVTALASVLASINWVDAADVALNLGTQIISAIVAGIKGAASIATDIITAITTLLSSIDWGIAADVALNLGTHILNAVVVGIEKAGDIASKIVSAISGILSTIDWEGAADVALSLGSQIIKAVVKGIESASSVATGIIDAVSNLIGSINWTDAADTALKLGTQIVDAVVKGIESAGSTAKSIISAIGTLLGNIDWESAADAAVSLGKQIVAAVVKGIESAGAFAKDIIGALGDVLNNLDWTTTALDSVTKLGNAIFNGIVKGIEQVGDVGTTLLSTLGDALGKIDWKNITISLDGFANMLINGIVAGLGKLTTISTDLATNLAAAVSKIPWATLADEAASLATTLFDGIVAGVKTITPNMNEMISAIGRGINEALSGLATVAGTIVGSLVSYLTSPENLAEFASVGLQFVAEIVKGILNLGVSLVVSAGDVLTNTLIGFFRGLFGIEVDPYVEQMLDDFESTMWATSDRFGEYGETSGFVLRQAMEATLLDTSSLEMAIEAWGIVVANGYADLMPEFAHLGNESVISLYRGMISELDSDMPNTQAMFEQAALLIGLGFGEGIENGIYAKDEALGIALNDYLMSGVIDISSLAAQYGYDIGELMGFSLPEGYAMAIVDGEPAIVEACGSIVDASRKAISTGSTVAELMAGIWDHNFQTAFAEINKWKPELVSLLEKMGVEAGSLLGVTLPEGVAQGLKDGTMSVQEAAAAIAAAAITTQADVDKANKKNQTAGEEAGEGLATGEKSAEDDVKNASQTLVDAADTGASGLPEVMTNTGAAGGNGMVSGLKSTTSEVEEAAVEVTSAAVEKFVQEMNFTSGSTIGKNFGEGIMSGLNSVKAAIRATAAVVASSVKNTVTSIISLPIGTGIGYLFAKGIAEGISNGVDLITDAATKAAQAAVNASETELDINSPSRVGEKEVGFMYDAGIAKGILGNYGVIAKAAGRVTESMHDSFLIGDPSRGTVYTAHQVAQHAANEHALGNDSAMKQLVAKAKEIGSAIAEELIDSGALEGDMYMDGEAVGRKVSRPVSRNIHRDTKKTISGRTGKAVFA